MQCRCQCLPCAVLCNATSLTEHVRAKQAVCLSQSPVLGAWTRCYSTVPPVLARPDPSPNRNPECFIREELTLESAFASDLTD